MDRFHSVSEHTFDVSAILAMLRCTTGAYADAEVAIADVPVTRVRPLTAKLRSVRVIRAAQLISRLRAEDREVFEPTVIHRDSGRDPWRLLLPPVLERHGQGYVIIDGTHRFAAARQLGERRIRALTVLGVDAPLPCTPKEWSELQFVDERLPTREMLGEMDMSVFRPVAPVLGRLSFPTRAALEQFMSTDKTLEGGLSWPTNG